MDYTIKGLQAVLGDKIKSGGDYLITTHREAGTLVGQKTHVEVGKVPDASLNEAGTMVVLERVVQKASVKDSVKQAVLGVPKPTAPAAKPTTFVAKPPEPEETPASPQTPRYSVPSPPKGRGR